MHMFNDVYIYIYSILFREAVKKIMMGGAAKLLTFSAILGCFNVQRKHNISVKYYKYLSKGIRKFLSFFAYQMSNVYAAAWLHQQKWVIRFSVTQHFKLLNLSN